MLSPARASILAALVGVAACSGSDPTPADPDAGGGDGDGGGGLDAPGVVPGTPGCGQPSTIATQTWVSTPLDVGGSPRQYFVRLPDGYDPARRYPIVYQLHGCSTAPNREANNVPVENASGADAIHIRGRAADTCWDAAPTGVDVAYFDAMRTAVEAQWCVDPARRFVTGYSSGSFMAHRLACLRGDLLRGVATIAGGQGGSNCAGPVAALLIHDANDTTVNISASQQARDNHLIRNACAAASPPTPTEHPPCVSYGGCTAGLPVVWCQTSGQNHARQDGLAAPIFWDFLSTLPARP